MHALSPEKVRAGRRHRTAMAVARETRGSDVVPRVEEQLAAIRQEQRAQRAILEQILEARRPSRLSRVDRDLLSRMVPAIGGAIGSEAFACRELITHPAPALAIVLAGVNAKRLGRLFTRAAGVAVDGLMV